MTERQHLNPFKPPHIVRPTEFIIIEGLGKEFLGDSKVALAEDFIINPLYQSQGLFCVRRNDSLRAELSTVVDI